MRSPNHPKARALALALILAITVSPIVLRPTQEPASAATAARRVSTTTSRPRTTATSQPATTATTQPATTTTRPVTTTTAAPIVTTATTSTTATTAPPAPPTTAAAATTMAPPNGGYATRIEEGFNSTTWYQSWGLLARPGNTGIVTVDGQTALGVRFNAGSHDGTSFMRNTGTADEVHVRYRLRLPDNWDPSQSSSNVKFPGFGNPMGNEMTTCLAGCGGFPANGITAYSARGDVHASGVPGYYVYHADMPQTLPSYGLGQRWNTPAWVGGRWYTIDLQIRMNTPGQRDGILRAWVDGGLVFQGTQYNFRTVSLLHVGNVWFDFYYGGSGVAPQQMVLAIDDVLIEY